MHRTTIILGLVAVGLLAFIVFFERDMFTSRELDEREKNTRLLRRFVRERVDKLELQRHGEMTVLVRERDSEDEFDPGTWKLHEPYEAKADQELVDVLLGQLQYQKPRRVLEGISEEDRARFGFDEPRLRLWFTVGKHRIPVVFGKPDPRGEGVYVTLDDPTRAYVVGKDLLEGVNHDAAYFYSKELHDGVLVSTTESVVLRGETTRHIEKREGIWWLLEPHQTWASEKAVDKLIGTLDRIQATRLVARQWKSPDKYGLASPHLEMVLQEQPSGADEEPQRLRLRVGAPCGEHEDERYVVAGDQGPLMCIEHSDVARLNVSADALRDERLLALPGERLEALYLARGDRHVALRREDEAWSYRVERAQREVSSGEAEGEAVERWLDALRGLEAAGFRQLDEAGLRQAGLAKPRLSLTIAMHGGAEHRLSLSAASGGEVAVRRDDSPVVLTFDARAAELLEPVGARFEPLQVLDMTTDRLTRLEVRTKALTQVLAREQKQGWMLREPVQVAADRVMAREAARALSKLAAERFVDDLPAPEHGLEPPWAVIGGAYEGDLQHELRLGAASDGGRFAQLDGKGAVFTVAQRVVSRWTRALVDRTVLATPLEQLASLTIDMVGAQRRLDKDGGQWAWAEDASSALAAQDVAKALARLRAQGAEYAAPSGQHGARRPKAQVTVQRTEDAPEPRRYDVVIGAAVDEASTRYAWRQGLPVVFQLPDEQVQVLLGESPPDG